MDPFSQAALGAVVGQAVGHRRLGYRAAAVGALAGALPDIDVLFSVGGDYFDQLVLHRGITHSLIFAPLVGPALAALIWRAEVRRASPAASAVRSGSAPAAVGGRPRLYAWMAVVTLALLSHPLLDYLTPYGTQLLLPFSNTRFAINAMPIIDPVYTLLLAAGLLLAGRWLRTRATEVAMATLIVSSAYLGYGAYLNSAAEREAARQLAAEGITDASVAAFPTLLQVHYRRVVARLPDEDRVGFLSMWQPCDIRWQSRPRREPPALDAFLATREGRIFDWFTMGWGRYRLERLAEGLLLHATDLRYGFNEDPDQSLFAASAWVGSGTALEGPVRAGRQVPEQGMGRLATLFEDTYAPLCRLTHG
ncbi:MAG: metal-dependent hydrolase [Pseudomonadales bacterium]